MHKIRLNKLFVSVECSEAKCHEFKAAQLSLGNMLPKTLKSALEHNI